MRRGAKGSVPAGDVRQASVPASRSSSAERPRVLPSKILSLATDGDP
jgi:hypothetical protein